jgi:hypothetical protein
MMSVQDICMADTVQLMKAGLDEQDNHCKRFLQNVRRSTRGGARGGSTVYPIRCMQVLPICFQKILQDKAVGNWPENIVKSIYGTSSPARGGWLCLPHLCYAAAGADGPQRGRGSS